MMRPSPTILPPSALTASVCARSMASPSRISTSEGGITTPSVLDMHTSAALRSAAMPDASRRGCNVRASIATPAPTEPFIGARITPRPSPASGVPQPVHLKARAPVRSNISASGRRFSSAPIKIYSGSACKRSFSSSPSRRLGIALNNGSVKIPTLTPTTANNSATPINNTHAGNPVVTIIAATTTSIHTPAVSINVPPARGRG